MATKLEFPDLVEMIVKHNLADLHTSLPAKIVTIDYKTQKATVQPLIKDRSKDAGNNPKGLEDMPVIQGVPVIFPSASTGTITFPIKSGDIVLLVFCERSLDNWLYSDGKAPVDPEDYRKHNYSDAFCIAGLYPFQKALGIDPENVVIRMNIGSGNENKISLKPNGDVVVDSPTKFIVNSPIVQVNAETSVTIDSPQTTMTGELRVDGGISAGSDVETDAGFSANTHVHIGNLSKPTSAFVP